MKISERVARINKALEPLKADLLAAGVRFKSSGEIHLLHKEDYPIGLPTIVAHLRMAYDYLPKAIMTEAFCYTKNIRTRSAWRDIYQIIGRSSLSQNTHRLTSLGTLYPEKMAGDCFCDRSNMWSMPE